MDTNVLSKIGYGLYILTAAEKDKDNGCIINTVMQVTSNPCQLTIAINKANYTSLMVQRTKKFNISILTKSTPFDTIKLFGYQSGKNINKFSDFKETNRSENKILYITKNTNSFISCNITQEHDLQTHYLFIAEAIDAKVFNNEPTLTYDYYQQNIKPKPQNSNKKGWRCKICGFIYEEEILPPDYICPVCKHGAIDFEKL